MPAAAILATVLSAIFRNESDADAAGDTASVLARLCAAWMAANHQGDYSLHPCGPSMDTGPVAAAIKGCLIA